MDSWPEDAPAPRLCHLVRWPDFSGYGFNLRCARSNPSQFVSEVDEGSPAHLGGLRKGDRIVEVNGVNVNNENHYQVVERIKQNPAEVKLLVVDEDTDKWYKQRDLSVHPPTSGQPNVIRIRTPTPRPTQTDAKRVEMASVSPVSIGTDSSLEQAGAADGNHEDADHEDQHSIRHQATRAKSPPMSPDSGKGDEEPHAASNGTGSDGHELTIEAEISHRKSTDSIKFTSKSNKMATDSSSNSNVLLSASPVNGDRSSKVTHTKTKHRDGVDSGQSSSCDSSSISNESITDSLDEIQSAQRFVKDEIEKSLIEHQEISRSNSNPEQDDNRTHIEVKTRPPISQKPSNIMVAKIREQLDKEGENNKIPDEITTIADNYDDISPSDPNTKKLDETKLADSNNWNSITNLDEQTESRKINSNNNDYAGLNLNMSANEMRELLARRKKFDPKKAQMNIRQKYEMIQRM